MSKNRLLILTILFSLTSCNNVKPFKLDDKYYNKGNVIQDENYELLNSALNDKESFVVVIYSLLTCINNFKDDIAGSYLSDKKIDYYLVDYESGKQYATTITSTIKYTPSVLIYKKGKCIDYLKADNNDYIEAYSSKEGFASWFEKYIILEK